MPGRRAWRLCLLIYVLFLAAAAPIGVWSGFFRPGAPRGSAIELLTAAIVIVVQPAMFEEVVFRGLLLPRHPRSTRTARLAFTALVALVLYVASHPLNAILFRPSARGVFESPAYLAMVALLGAACTAAYWASKSLWPPIAMHWLTVVVWLWFLGGQALLC